MSRRGAKPFHFDPNGSQKAQHQQQQQQQMYNYAGGGDNDYDGFNTSTPIDQIKQMSDGTTLYQIGGKWYTKTESRITTETEGSWRSYFNIESNWPLTGGYTTPVNGIDDCRAWFTWIPAVFRMWIWQACAMAFFSMFVGFTFFKYNSVSTLDDQSRAFGVGITYFLTQLIFGIWTGGYFDLYITLLVTFSEFFFVMKENDVENSGVQWSALGKGLLIITADCVGSFVGVALISIFTGFKINTGDCIGDPSTSCFIRPVIADVGLSEGRVKVLFFVLVWAGMVFACYTLRKHKPVFAKITSYTPFYEPVPEHGHRGGLETVTETHTVTEMASGGPNFSETDIRTTTANTEGPSGLEMAMSNPPMRQVTNIQHESWLLIAAVMGASTAYMTYLFSTYIGLGFNFWLVLVTDAYTGNFGNAIDFMWEGLVAALIIFVLQLLHWLEARYRVMNRIATGNYGDAKYI